MKNTLEYGWWAKTTNITGDTQCHKPLEDLYPNIYAIFTVFITMPVSSASSEHSVSAMRRVTNSWSYNEWWEINKFIVVTHPQKKKSKRRRCYQQICSEKKQTSGLYLITSPYCWTWWLHVLTWTLKLYSFNVSGNVSFIHIAFMIIFAIDSMLCDAEFL